MKKLKYLSFGLLGLLAFAGIAYATVFYPYQGGTGTNVSPGKGTVLVGSSSIAYSPLATSTDGLCLVSSSTAPLGVVWQSCSSGGISGSGTSTQVAYYSASNTLTSSANLTTDGTNITVSGTSTLGTIHFPSFSNTTQIYANGDTNSGIYFPSPDGFGILTGGTTRFLINSSGMVGVSTTTPATALVVNGQTTITSLGTGLVKSTSGILGNATSGIDYQAPITSALPFGSSTHVTILAGSNILVSTLNGTTTIAWNAAPATSTITSATTTDLSTTNLKVNTLTGVLRANSGVVTTANSTDFVSSVTAQGGLVCDKQTGGITCWNALTFTAGTGIGIASSSGNSWTITNNGVQSLTASTSIGLKNSTGTVNIGALNYPIQGVFTYATSTANTAATSTIADDLFIFDATSTIRDIWVKNQTSNDFLTFNLYYGTSSPANNATTTGLQKIFSADKVFSNTSSTVFTPTASSTPGRGAFLRLFPYSASSTEFTITIFYDQN